MSVPDMPPTLLALHPTAEAAERHHRRSIAAFRLLRAARRCERIGLGDLGTKCRDIAERLVADLPDPGGLP